MTQSQLTDVLVRFPSISVGVIGDFCLDAYWQLDEGAPELSLETGKPTLAVSEQRYSPGGAGNVATNIAALGVGHVYAFGALGEDLFGDEVLAQLRKISVNTDGVIIQKTEWHTPVYAKPYLGAEEQSRIDFGRFNVISHDTEQKLIGALTSGISQLDALVVNQQIPRSIFTPGVIAALNALAVKYPQKVFLLDSRHRITEFRSMICKVNAIEAAALFGKRIHRNEECTTDELADFARKLFDGFRRPVFITRSRLGILLFDEDGITELPAADVKEPTDPVGAGDTVVAALASALAAGASPSQAASLAVLAAAVTVRKLRQTGTATPEEILDTARTHPHFLHL